MRLINWKVVGVEVGSGKGLRCEGWDISVVL